MVLSLSSMMGFQTLTIGFLGDTIAANRKLIEDIQYRVRKQDCKPENSENYKDVEIYK